jgi:ferrous iron transport protein A
MDPVMPLNMVSEGNDCKVYRVNDGSGNALRLRELGFIDQVTIRVFRSDNNGMIVGLNGCRLALSRGIAKDILVTV